MACLLSSQGPQLQIQIPSRATGRNELNFKRARLPQSRDMPNCTAATGIGWPERQDSHDTSTSCFCDLQLCFKLPLPLI